MKRLHGCWGRMSRRSTLLAPRSAYSVLCPTALYKRSVSIGEFCSARSVRGIPASTPIYALHSDAAHYSPVLSAVVRFTSRVVRVCGVRCAACDAE